MRNIALKNRFLALLTSVILLLIVITCLHQRDTPSTLRKKSVPLHESTSQYVDAQLAPRNVMLSPAVDYCKDLKFLVVVHTRLSSHRRRDQIRNLYGRGELERKFRYKIVFPVGTASDEDHRLKRQRSLEEESRFHGDILQADYEDTYKNVTMKQLSHLRYYAANCSENTILLKLDDDVVWSVKQMSSFLQSNHGVMSHKIACLLWKGMPVERNNDSRWYISQSEYENSYYPDYCSGMSYIAGHKAIERMLVAAMKLKYFWIDDVFITGMLTSAASVKLESIELLYDLHGKRFNDQSVLFFLSNRKSTKERFYLVNGNATLPDAEADYHNEETFSDY